MRVVAGWELCNDAGSMIRFGRSALKCLHNTVYRQNTCQLHMSVTSESGSSFKEAQNRVNSLREDPGNQVKLQLYALFKQATVGTCDVPKPGMMDFVGKAKWEAWKAVGNIPQDAAKERYVKLVEDLVSKEASAGSADTAVTGGQMSTLVMTSVVDNIHVIKINRPEKKNALTMEMYTAIMDALKVAGTDSTSLTVLTGAGDYYCSGNDLSNFTDISPQDIPVMAKKGGTLIREYVDAFIDFPKPLVALVNGPAVGISVTTLGLFDLVYATDQATFWSPFTSLGQSPEGCSSYLFPKIMGYAQASQLLLFNQRLTAQVACQLGIVTEVFPHHVFQQEAWNRIRDLASLPRDILHLSDGHKKICTLSPFSHLNQIRVKPDTAVYPKSPKSALLTSLRLSKQLLHAPEIDILHKTNERECALLVERWQSDECMNAIMKFFQSKL